MNCKEFQEIAPAYPSDELSVESNLQIESHLQSCPRCRQEAALNAELSGRVRSATRSNADFQIDPQFAARLQTELRRAAHPRVSHNALRSYFWKFPKFYFPATAALVFVLTVGWFAFRTPNAELPKTAQNVVFDEFVRTVAGNHRDCALEKMQLWEKLSRMDSAQKAFYEESVVKPLNADFSKEVKFLHAHDCVFRGKQFKHIILLTGETVLSVFTNKTDVTGLTINENEFQTSTEGEFQVIGFERDKRLFFVVSTLPADENRRAAQILSQHSLSL